MAKYSNVVSYNIQTTLDASGIAKLQAEIRNVELELQKLASQDLISNKAMSDAQSKISQLRTMISSSFNANLGMLDMTKFSKQLQSSKTSLDDFRRAFSTAGAAGETAFNNTLNRLTKLDTGLVSVSKTTDKLFNSIGNTVRWGIVASGFQTILNSAHQTVQYVRDLDTSLTNIMMVTQQSKEQMNEFAQSANDAAKALSSTTVNMTDAALVFAQQGFNTDMSSALAERSTQLANISQQDTATTSDQITTIMNAYDFTGDLAQIDAAMNSWANVANVSAADVEELATAAQKAASTANTTGVTLDQLNAQIATIESVTREAPENIGNALKTIYSRFADISLGNTLEDGVDLGTIAETLGQVGVEVLDDEGRMNNVGDVMEQLMEVWQTLDQTQQNAISTVIAGRYQLSRFQALMNRSDLYQDYLGASQNAEGTADQMQEIYANSMEGRLNKLQATAEGIFNDIFNTDDFYGMIDALTTVLDLTNQWVDSIGGGANMLQGLGAIATRVFSKNIAAGLTSLTGNFSASRQQQQNLLASKNMFAQNGLDIQDPKNAKTLEYIQKGLAASTSMTTEQQEKFNETKEQALNLASQQADQEEQIYQTILATNQAAKQLEGIDEDVISFERDEQGRLTNIDASKYNQLVASGKLDPEEVLNQSIAGTSKIYNETEPLLRVYENLEKHLGNFTAGNEKITSLKGAWTAYGKTLKGVVQELGEASNESQELVTANKAIGESFKSFDGTEESIQKIVKAIEAYGQKIREVRASGEGGKVVTNQELGKMIGDYEATKMKKDTNDEYLSGQIQGFDKQANIQSIVNATTAVGQLAFAWQSFQSLGSIWSNSDLEYGEKILQTIMNLSTALPMLITGVQDLKGGVGTIVRGLATLNPLMATTTATTVAATAATTAEAGAATGAAAATMSFGTALRYALGPLAIIGTILGLVVGVVTALVKAYNADADAARKASDEAQKLGESYQNLKSSYDSFEQNVDAYTTARQELSGLTEGTKEYNDALEKSNDELLKMLELYPELAKYVSRDENGGLVIKDSDIEDFKKEQEAILQEAEAATTIANVNADQKALTSSETSLRRQINYADIDATGYAYTATLSQSELEAIYGLMSREGEDSVYNKEDIAELFNTDISDPMVQAIVDAADKIVAAYGDREATEAANEIQLEEAAKSALENQTGYDLEGDIANDVMSYVAEQANPESTLYQENLKTNQALSTEDMAMQYAQNMGLTYTGSDWAFDGKGENARFMNSEGEEVEVSRGIMENFLTASQSLEQAASKWSTVADQFSAIANSDFSNLIGEDSNDLMEEWEAGGAVSLSSLSGREQQNLSDRLANGNLTTEELFGDMSQEEINQWATEHGFESGESFAASFSNGLREALGRENVFEDILNRDDLLTIQEDQSVLTDSSANIARSDAYKQQAEDILNAVDSVYELNEAFDENLLITDDFNKGLINLAADYSDLEDESNRLRKTQDKYQEVLNDTEATAEDTNDAYFDMLDAQEELNDALKTKEWDKARDSLEEYTDALENADTDSEEYAKASQEVADSLSDLTGFDIDTDWIDNNRQAVVDWLNGVEGAGAKLNALLNIDNASANVQNKLADIGVSYDNMRAQIANNTIQFNATGFADFSQVQAAMHALRIDTNDTSSTLEYLAAYLNALGGASLVLEHDGNTTSIPAPDMTGDPDEVTAAINSWIQDIQGLLDQGWSFSGIDLPDSPQTIPTSSPTAPAPTGGGGGGGSKGGGGGSGKSYEPKKKDPIEDELDRYERVNTLLEDAENRYDRLNADRERLTGFDMADDMEKEVELLNRQIALHREKLEIQKEEAQELRDELSSQYGITFDAEGFITNYATTHDRLVNEVNSLINQYNNTTTEEGQEALEEQIEDAQDALDDFNETYQRYDELWAGDMQETLNTLEDLEDQIEDIRIEMMNTSIEAVDNLQDLQESLNEFNNTFEHFGEDTGLRDAELATSNLATYFDIANESASALYDTLIQRANDRLNSGLLSDDERQKIQQDIAMWENARKQIGDGSMEAGGTGLFDMAFNNMHIIQEQIRQYESTGTSTIFGENSSDLYDAAKEAYDQATGLLSDFEGHYEDLHDAILDMIDETAESIEKRKEQYENITDELDHQREIIELIHGDEAYDQINMVLDAQQQNYLASISEMQQTLDYWKEMLTHMEEGSEEWEAINEQIMDTQSELNDLVEESLDNLQEKYENTVNNILNQWTSSAFGGTDLDWVAEEWELINRNADYYLDDVNAAYETQKLQGKYLEMLDNTDDLHIQQMITEQMKQQLGYLRDKEKLSEYDVAYANAQLEILQKRIALEEAQRNKSQMQLRRDSQGNYSYVYTADEGDVAAAEGDLLDAQNNAYNLSKEQMKQTQDDSLSALQDAQQLLNDIWTNANLTLDEKTERTQTVIDSLKEYLNGTAEQLSESEKNIINDFIGMAEMMTDENGERIEDVLEQVKNGNLEAFDIIDTRWSTALSNWLYNLEDFNLSTDDSFSQLIENSVEFQDNIDAIAGKVNQDFSDMGDTIAGVVDQTKDLASSTADFINQLKSDSGVILEYEDQLESMREKIADTTNEMRAYQQQVNQLQSDLTAKEQENANLSAEIETLRKENESLKNPGGSGGGGGGSNFGGSGYSQSDLAWGIAQNIWTYGWAGGWGNDPTRSGKLTGAYGSGFARQVQDIINKNWRSGSLVNYGSDKFSSYSLIGYDTGGYTGSWSDGNSDAKNGKLAYLHQKELVLNASDTENILKAVDIVRQMVQTLKNSAVTDVFSNIANSISAQSSGETVEQNVHITAEFPAANSAAEIESALLSLNERAIQYSFRKK